MRDLTEALRVERWNGATAKEQQAAAQVVADMLQSAGRPLEFRGLRSITPFFPESSAEGADDRTIATFFDREHELDWVLIPGGTVRAWGKRERKLLREALGEMEGFREERGESLRVEDIRPYGAPQFEFSRMFRPAVELPAFLTTAMPLLGSTRALGALDAKRPRLSALSPQPSVFTLHRDELDGLLRRHGWGLPNARQSEWMTGSGQFIFPWGDALPRWMWDAAGMFEEEDLDDPGRDPPDDFELHFRSTYESPSADWTCANGFGLIDALVASHWVDDDGALASHGGAGECYPWQACGEWAGFITAAVAPEPAQTEAWVSHALRPVIELAR